MLNSPVLNAIATERPVIIIGVDSKIIWPIIDAVFPEPLAKGPPKMYFRARKACESGTSLDVSAIITKTIHPIKMPEIIHIREVKIIFYIL